MQGIEIERWFRIPICHRAQASSYTHRAYYLRVTQGFLPGVKPFNVVKSLVNFYLIRKLIMLVDIAPLSHIYSYKNTLLKIWEKLFYFLSFCPDHCFLSVSLVAKVTVTCYIFCSVQSVI